ncbi:MAG: hypothetical protein Q7U76_12415 [Nitrospirota bacterium]|nr:hypothetical protein [Nitrospirota bacterium]
METTDPSYSILYYRYIKDALFNLFGISSWATPVTTVCVLIAAAILTLIFAPTEYKSWGMTAMIGVGAALWIIFGAVLFFGVKAPMDIAEKQEADFAKRYEALENDKKMLEARLEVKARNAKIREDLDRFVFRAHHIQQHFSGIYLSDIAQGATPDSEFSDWHGEIRQYLNDNLPGHTGRFEDIMSGQMIVVPQSASNPNIWGVIERYKGKLGEFWKEYYDPQDAAKS